MDPVFHNVHRCSLCTVPQIISELVAYMLSIIHMSREYSGLAWVQYDVTFCKHVALKADAKWSVINPTLYTQCLWGQEGMWQGVSYVGLLCMRPRTAHGSQGLNPHGNSICRVSKSQYELYLSNQFTCTPLFW